VNFTLAGGTNRKVLSRPRSASSRQDSAADREPPERPVVKQCRLRRYQWQYTAACPITNMLVATRNVSGLNVPESGFSKAIPRHLNAVPSLLPNLVQRHCERSAASLQTHPTHSSRRRKVTGGGHHLVPRLLLQECSVPHRSPTNCSTLDRIPRSHRRISRRHHVPRASSLYPATRHDRRDMV
jgi:hypothetical protein